MIEYRSDTFTLPTEEMKRAMVSCELGDDVYGEDPTINKLEEYTADITGKEASIFLPTCTMANLIAVGVHCDERFSEIILGRKQHIHKYEVGGISSLTGVHSLLLPNNEDGTMSIEQVEEAIRPFEIHYPFTKVIAIENTHNVCGGRVLHPEYVQALANIAQSRNVAVHMDGARVLNAAAALGLSLKEVVKPVDSVSICLSKGLSAPAGALLVGSRTFIKRARHMRKALGGGMRQAGVLAACGLIALETMSKRLVEDHAHAKELASKLIEIEGLSVKGGIESVESNMFFLGVAQNKAKQLCEALKSEGIMVDGYGTDMLRLVTHKDVSIKNVNHVRDMFHKHVQALIQ